MYSADNFLESAMGLLWGRLLWSFLGLYQVIQTAGVILEPSSAGIARRVRNLHTGQTFWLQEFNRSLLGDTSPEALHKLRSLVQVNRQEFINLQEVIMTPTQAFLVTEDFDGIPLIEHILHNGRLTSAEAGSFLFEIARAVSHLHDLGLEGFLNPHSVLLCKDGKIRIHAPAFRAILDQGSIEVDEGSAFPLFSAPEMWTVEPVERDGQKTDSFVIGVLFFMMLTGKFPFEGEDDLATLWKVQECQVIFPPHVGEQERDLLDKVFVAEPKRRFNVYDIQKKAWCIGMSFSSSKEFFSD